MKRSSIYKIIGSFLAVVIILFVNLNCKKNESLEAKQASKDNEAISNSAKDEANNENFALVTNPNGIPFYKTVFDKKSKSDSIAYGEKIIFTYEPIESESEEVNQWHSITFKGKKGYIYSMEPYNPKDWFTLNPARAYNEETKKDEEAFSIVQTPRTKIYELPSSDAKPIGELEQYSMVKVWASGTSYDSFISNNLDLEMGGNDRVWSQVSIDNKQGFVLNAINYPTTKSLAQAQANEKIINQKGYFLVTSKSLNLYHTETKQSLLEDYKFTVKQENTFLDSTESRLINGEQVYLVYINDKIDIQQKKKSKKPDEDYPPYAVYISSKDGAYFGEQKFSDYTVANTRFKGDLNAISIMRSEFEKRGIFLNYLDFTLRKISNGNYPQDVFLIASAYVGYYDKETKASPNMRSIILKQTDGVYEPVSGSIYTSSPVQFKDLDSDGLMEMIVKSPTRGGDETVIYGLKDGKYVSMNAFLNEMSIYEVELKGNKVRGKKWVTSPDGKTSKEEIHYFKYEKGNFVEVKK